ncbi:S41 family peptidase [Pseudemcibacter aquimaris]|uniref:S41 family peptidase n=1 Tax=Pseudemcibacter aquimaris TaxID=2857064 RepID=UPI002010DFC7|nr:S41 family peptidase [Pseudemcibacter aquimaris]MCC3861103.1 hypothetical protein [Pseudemcibacter aquimaris]WDU59921.1 hypothetical protein KW060_06585 [Pseudemcibacter aquimaris]
MRFIRLFSLFSLITITATFAQQENTSGNWHRDVAISPDGSTVLFTHMGDIYSVSADGGMAMPLTTAASWEGNPVWSPDGKWIAFASDRHGNMDIFLLPATGGQISRLTYHSGDDIPTDFAHDGSSVLFTSSRYDKLNASEDPARRDVELYQVPLSGGTPSQVLPIVAIQAKWNNDGSTLIYANDPGLEQFYRKHDDSPFARDVWLANPSDGTFEQLTTNKWNDTTPAFSDDQGGFYFLSDRSGTVNVWHQTFSGGEDSAKQLSFHDLHAVRDLSVADNGRYAYNYFGTVYVANPNEAPQQLNINIMTNSQGALTSQIPVGADISEFTVSPDGKEIAYIARGNIFVTALEFGTTKQITNTPGLERNVGFTPDGRGLVYASERMERWQIYQTSLVLEDETHFYVSTKLNEEKLIEAENSVFNPIVSPDGKQIAYTNDWDEVRVYDIESGRSHSILAAEHNYSSMSVGSITTSWSPDSKWIAVDMEANGRLFFPNVAIVASDGSGETLDISQSGYADNGPQWHKNGGIISWATDRYGRRDHGGHGSDRDVYAQFLTQDAWDDFRRNKEQVALDEEASKEDKDEENGDDEAEEEIPVVTIELESAIERQARLTIHSSRLAGFALNEDASKLYYLARFESGYDLWVHDFREETTSKLAKLDARSAGMEMTTDGKNAIVLTDGKLQKIVLEDGKTSPIAAEGTMALDANKEREAMLYHLWQVTNDRIYNPDVLVEAKWDQMYGEYAAKVAAINNNRDFSELLAELTGELDVSHANSRYLGKPIANTGAIGAILDHANSNDSGILIADVLEAGPLSKASDRAAAGNRIIAINDVKLDTDVNYYQHMLETTGKRTRLTLADDDGEFDVVVTPVSQNEERAWLREQWVLSRHDLVEELSGGRLGYVYVPNMSDNSYRRVYRDLFGRHYTKEAVIIDVRDNGGGDLVDWLVQLFSGTQYMWNVPNGRVAQGEPLTEWVKPSIALVNQGAYSDGSCFTAAWLNLDVSTVVGTPVTGTCSYAGWETTASGDIRAGTPPLGIYDPDGKFLERQTDHPDVLIYADPESVTAGRDVQLEKAVETMLMELDNK